jgi:hypothetical protein
MSDHSVSQRLGKYKKYNLDISNSDKLFAWVARSMHMVRFIIF